MRRYVMGLALFAVLLWGAEPGRAGFISSSGDPALGGATLIDFNAETKGTFTSRSFASGSVTFSVPSGAGSLAIDDTLAGQYGTSGRYLETQHTIPPSQFDIAFAPPVSAFGFVWGAADTSWVMSVTDSTGASYNIAAQTSPYIGFVGASGTTITNVHLQNTDPNLGFFDWILLDDLRFVTAAPSGPTTPAVPEPASIITLAIGAVGLLGYTRRRRANS